MNKPIIQIAVFVDEFGNVTGSRTDTDNRFPESIHRTAAISAMRALTRQFALGDGVLFPVAVPA